MTATRQKAIDIINVMPEIEVEKFVNLNIKFEKTKKAEKNSTLIPSVFQQKEEKMLKNI